LDAAAVTASAELAVQRLGGGGDWLLALPPGRIAGVNVLARALIGGGSVTRMDGPFGADAFAARAAAMGGGPKFTALVPTQLKRLLAAGGDGIVQLARFQAVLVGGAPLDRETRRRAEAGGVRLIETYGMAETCGGCVWDGVPLEAVGIEVVDDVVEIAGPVLALGDCAADGGGEAVQAPRGGGGAFGWRDGRRWHRSRDLGRLQAGRLTVLGRADNAVTSGGVTISPEAVEAVLAEAPWVAQGVVVGLPSEEWGEELVAVVVARDERGADAGDLEELRRRVARRLGRAAAPRELAVVQSIPELGPGKTDRPGARRLAVRQRDAGATRRVG
jgi:O-succinylbenzoic acid--CoA ligase